MKKVSIIIFCTALFLLCAGLLSYPAGTSKSVVFRWHNRMKIKDIGQRILCYQINHGWTAKKLSDVFTSENLKRSQVEKLLCAYGVDQTWKPKGWLNDPQLLDIYSDYILVPSNRIGILVMERPGLWFQKKDLIAVAYVDQNPGSKQNHRIKESLYKLSMLHQICHTYADEDGIWREHAYDANRNRAGTSCSDGSAFLLGHDSFNRLVCATNEFGIILSFAKTIQP